MLQARSEIDDATPAAWTGPATSPHPRQAAPGRQPRRAGAEPERNVALDLLFGALAGAAAVWVMDRVDWFNYRRGIDDERSRRRTRHARPGGLDPAHVVAAKAADAAGRPLSPSQLDGLGLAIHYGIGIVPVALYGALRGRVPYIDAGRGSLYSLSMFLGQDEILNAAAGVAGHPRDYPWQAHARGFVAHLVYGLVTDTACRALSAGYQELAQPSHAHPDYGLRGVSHERRFAA